MKTPKNISAQEALHRLQLWTKANIPHAPKHVTTSLASISENTSIQPIIDIAFFLQYAYINELDYFDIVETVLHDLSNYTNNHYILKSSGYQAIYQHQLTLLKINEKLTDVSIISAIIASHFSDALQTTKNIPYYRAMEIIGETATKIYDLQSRKPIDTERNEYVDLLGISAWDEWVVLEASKLLTLHNPLYDTVTQTP